jgi:hypothetical protein
MTFIKLNDIISSILTLVIVIYILWTDYPVETKVVALGVIVAGGIVYIIKRKD